MNDRINRVIYKKNSDTKNNIITSNFVIINNSKITCPLNIQDGKLLPTMVLEDNDRIFQYVLGLRASIPNLTRYCVNPREIEVDLISERFDTNLISTGDIENIIQYSLNEKNDEIDQFYKVDDAKYEIVNINNVESQSISYEERLYLNFKTGFVFSIINKGYKLIYIYVENCNENVISEIYSEQDIGAISRILKYWPELNLTIALQNTRIKLQSFSIKNIFQNHNPNKGVIYLFKRHNIDFYKIAVTHIKV